MEIQMQDRDNMTVVTLKGRFVMEAAMQLRDQILASVDQAQPIVVIDMTEVDYIDSSGTGVLVHVLHGARNAQRRLILAHLHPSVERVFTLSNLDRVFEIAKTDEDLQRMAHPSEIFLFEDRDDIIFFFQEVIQANQMNFCCSADLESSLKHLQENPANLILIDALEKDEPKYEFIRRLKQDERLKTIPIVVLSIYEEEEFQFSQFGVDRFILKPFLVEKFVATVKQLLARSPKN